jgi:DNA-binding beta-propeller fold protein YncE
LKISKIKFLTFFAIICSIGLAPINNAYAATTFVDAKDVSNEDTIPRSLAFNTDGTKMFVIGDIGNDVNEYTCTTGFDVSSCSVVAGGEKDVSAEDTNPTGLAFNSDGTKMFVIGDIGDDVNEYTCTTGFDVSSCSVVAGGEKDVSAEETSPTGLAFNSDGTKMFVVGFNGDDVNEYTCTTGFDVSSCSVVAGGEKDVSAEETIPTGLAFNSDGTKMFVEGRSGQDVNEYTCTTGFDVSSCSFTDVFDLSGQEISPQGLAFNSDGTKMFVVGFDGDDVNEYTLEVGFDFDGVPVTETTTSSSDCYDCKPPVLQASHITISTNDYVVATGDDPLHITANVGDKVTVILNVTDNKSIQTIPFAGLYTNYQEKPSDMSAFYANNFDKWKHTSTSFYEWNIRADDVPYDYDGTVSWSDNTPTIVTGEITDENYFMINDNNVLEYFMMPFTFTMNQSMEESAITAKIYDASGNRLHVTLPVTLKVAGNEPLNFDYTGKQKVLGFYDESVLSEMVETWSESESDTKQMSSLLGISDESLPPWTSNLATWVAEGAIDSADLIVAVEYLINQ